MSTRLMNRMTRRRRAGKYVPPVVSAVLHRRYRISTAWNVIGRLWSLGRHTGADYACPTGSLAIAPTWGEIVFAGQFGGWSSKGTYGIHVVMRTADGELDGAHCHLSTTRVRVGDHVVPGQVLGLTGATGNVTGAHLHYEVRPAGGGFGSDVNPSRMTKRKALSA